MAAEGAELNSGAVEVAAADGGCGAGVSAGCSYMGCQVERFQETDSTNIQAKRLAEAGAPEGTLVITESQTAGKGRRGRSWVSPPGTGIWMSLVLKPRIDPSSASQLTLVAALAVAAGIEDACGLKGQIKWPNDIVMSGKKLCGILTEMSTEQLAIKHVIVGIGINVNMTDFPKEISQTASSLYLESGKLWDREPIISCIMRRMEEYYERFLETADLSGLKEEYEDRLGNRNRQVTVLEPKGAYSGLCRGITEDGELLVEREDGTMTQVMSGEVSVRGIYGYV